ncbi:MAG: deoxyribodipyrimidine photolyase [Chitinophagia bacterium]|nr:deoxyribodipyrimidine photolyase [Chitinophagia bacterium]
MVDTEAFPTDIDSILARVDAIDPVAYGRSRNFIDGAVTRLSPYISRGVISTRFVMRRMLALGHRVSRMQKFLQELAWRDYFQQVAMARPGLLDTDLRRPQPRGERRGVPSALAAGRTGIDGIDAAVRALLDTGYMHNHCRMYSASLACNLGRCHWRQPADWMYYHLLDADFASNACSWQWVSGAFSGKLYFADQANVNRYCHTGQRGSFLDSSYSELEEMEVPEALRETIAFEATTPLPLTEPPAIAPGRPVIIYNLYNLDPFWRKDADAERVLLLEPSHFRKLPVSARTIEFVHSLAANIPGIRVFTGEFDALQSLAPGSTFHFREHPLFGHYRGVCDPREWMFPDITGYYSSFFGFWKKAERRLFSPDF